MTLAIDWAGGQKPRYLKPGAKPPQKEGCVLVTVPGSLREAWLEHSLEEAVLFSVLWAVDGLHPGTVSCNKPPPPLLLFSAVFHVNMTGNPRDHTKSLSA